MRVHPVGVADEEVAQHLQQPTAACLCHVTCVGGAVVNQGGSSSYKLALVSSATSGRDVISTSPRGTCLCPECMQGPLSSSPPRPDTCLEDLPADVLHHILVCLNVQQIMAIKSCNSRLRAHVSAACDFWAARVEADLGALQGAQPLWESLQQREQQLQMEHLQLSAPAKQQTSRHLQHARPSPRKGLDWLQVWTCIQRCQAGPWHLDVHQLSPTAAPNGVLLVFELLLQPPEARGDRPAGGAVRWRDAVPVLTFCLDGCQIHVLVEPNGRVTSYEQDWCQGCIQLVPGQPQLLALEISYIFPIPAWFLHPCRKEQGGLALDVRTGFGSYVIDPRYIEPHSQAGAGAHGGLERCILGGTVGKRPSKMAALLTRLLPGKGRGGVRGRGARTPDQLSWYSQGASTSSSGSGTSSSSSNNSSRRPLAGYSRNAAGSQGSSLSRGQGRWEHGQMVAPGDSSSRSSNNSGRCRVTCTGVASGGGAAVGTGSAKAVGVIVRNASAWLVPADHEQRFKEGFLFSVEQQKLRQLLEQYNILPAAVAATEPTAARATPKAGC